MRTKLISILLVLSLILVLFTACKPDPTIVLFDQLQTLYSQSANHFDFAPSIKLAFQERPASDRPLFEAWFQALPLEWEFDSGITVKYNQDQLYLDGDIAFIGDSALVLRELQDDPDLRIELFVNRSEGVYFRSVDGFIATRKLYPEWEFPTESAWLKIGSVEAAQQIMSMIDHLRDTNQNRTLLEDNYVLINHSEENNQHQYETSVDMASIFASLSDHVADVQSKPTLIGIVSDFLKLTLWQATTTINYELNSISSNYQISFDSTKGSEAPILAPLLINFEGYIWESNYALNPSTDLSPKGEYE